ncbi:MAG: serine/threonine-protein kinase [Acidobacteriota bacterium]
MSTKMVRHFRLVKPLDEGSIPIFHAVNTKDDREVALKFLPFELKEDPAARKRFIDEAQAASSLHHPNICAVYEIGESEDGRMYAALEYHEGETLKRWLEKGPLPVDQAIDIARQIAAGLAEAHRTGLAHRDLVPANVLVSKDGTAKIIDFGLAKQVSQGGLTQIGWSLGTPEYMSPEQIRGADDDERTGDWWSLGIVLYEMVSGSQPFTGRNLAGVLTAIQQHDPPPLSGSRPEVPTALDGLVSRLLAKDPANRYGSAEELLRDLGERGAPLPAAPSSPPASAPRPAPPTTPSADSPTTAPAAGSDRRWLWAVLALLAIVTILWLLLAGRADGALLEAGRAHSDWASMTAPGVNSPALADHAALQFGSV